MFDKLKSIIKWVVVLFFSSTILSVVVYRFLPVYVTPLMVIRCFQQVADGESIKWHHHWVPLDEISDHLPVAVMASEDQRFLLHHGFDFGAIQLPPRIIEGGVKYMEQVRLVNRQPRMFFYGLDVHGREKVLRLILHS